VTLAFEIRLVTNPWPDTVPSLLDLLATATRRRAEHIAEQAAEGNYRRESLALVLLDPTAPLSRPTGDAVLAVISIGEEGTRFAPNAMAKAAEHRDHGLECGALALTQKHRLSDGDFRNGFSAEVNGTIVGASGQNSLQDQLEATLFAAEFNYEVARARSDWEEQQGRGGWFSAAGEGKASYTGIWATSALASFRSDAD